MIELINTLSNLTDEETTRLTLEYIYYLYDKYQIVTTCKNKKLIFNNED